LNLILGVVVNAATEARDNLAQELEHHKTLRSLEATDQLLSMCRDMDLDGSGELSLEEVQQGFECNPVFQDVLRQLDILDGNDIEIVWTILDPEKTGSLSFKRLVDQIYAMKSSRTHFMLAYIKFYITEIRDKLRLDFEVLRTALDKDFEVMVDSREDQMVKCLESGMGKLDGTMNALEHTINNANDFVAYASEQSAPPNAPEVHWRDPRNKQVDRVSELEAVRQQCLTSIQNLKLCDSSAWHHVEMLECLQHHHIQLVSIISSSISKSMSSASGQPETTQRIADTVGVDTDSAPDLPPQPRLWIL